MTLMRRLRIVLAAGLLLLLFWVVDLRSLLEALSNIRLVYIAYLFGLSGVLIWISCLKWQLFVRASGHEAGIWRLMAYYTTAYFFNMFFPSSVGGDVARSVQLGHDLKSHKTAFAATFVERYTGFLAMSLMGAAFVAGGAQAAAGVELAILSVAVLALLGGLVCFSDSLCGWSFASAVRLSRLAGMPGLSAKLERFLGKVLESTAFARNNSMLFAKAMVLSLVFHLLAVVNTYICALSVGWLDAPFGSLCIVVPLVLLVAVAPLTPNSIGIQEGAFLFLLMRVGATEPQGLGVALILRAKTVVTAACGGLVWLWLSSRRRSAAAEGADMPAPVTDQGAV